MKKVRIQKNILTNKLFLPICGMVLSLWISSCEEFTQIDPPKKQLVPASVFSNDASAMAALNGIYGAMIGNNGLASGDVNGSLTFIGGLSADELVNFSMDRKDEFYKNNISANNVALQNYLWQEVYYFIYYANAILEGIQTFDGTSAETKRQLEGEAKFVRAFSYFYLVNLFGDVPLHLTTSYQLNSTRPRTPSTDVYQQIILDLKDVQQLLPDNYSISNGERVRPNLATATALLARVYLYLGEWENAEAAATALIGNSAVYRLETDLNKVFLANSLETIWQLKPVRPGRNTNEGFNFILLGNPAQLSAVSLTEGLLQSFEEEDQRKIEWINSFTDGTSTWYYPFKYKIKTGSTLTEYSMVFRLAEQYLIRAEARSQLGNVSGAQEDLNALRSRAGLANTLAADKASLLQAIESERRAELFAEWGHRWLDLKRSNRADAVLSGLKAPTWQLTDVLYPIPQQEKAGNPGIIQNEGY